MMIKRTLVSLLVTICPVLLFSQGKPLTAGMKISRDFTAKKAVYRLAAPADTSRAVILIEGDHITIDFSHAQLRSDRNPQQPDAFTGIAILIRNSRNVTIKNLGARGYKIALLARNVEKLTIVNCDFSYNYRPRLNSTQEKEDISDWMSYHHNDKDEWLRYGAAIYLRDCDSAVIRNNKVTGGQNALMMTQCDDGLVTDNDLSFNSGIGLGMYRCNRNRVLYNRVIFNVRGYSDGVYHRGQDSAGMLVYEQSNDNEFLYNNVTHGGDGFFLWAGQTTMDTGQGGCNNNVIIGNDFSYAPTNGIEVTFSSNYIANNRIFGCDHGIWGGYSYRTTIAGNQFRDNRVAIAIEHGQHNLVDNNLFAGDRTAIRLWANKTEPSGWGYPKYRDTRSVAYHILKNSFNNHQHVFSLARTDSLWVHDNTFNGIEADVLKFDSTITRFDSLFDPFPAGSPVEPGVFKTRDDKAFRGSGKYRGRKNIGVTEWGPYDFQYPLIWHVNPVDTGAIMQFDLLGPEGKWFIKKVKGVKNISADKGMFPASITAEKIKGERTDIAIELEYTGGAFTTLFGENIPAGKKYAFSFSKFFQPIDWEVRFFSIDTTFHNPVTTGELFAPNVRMAPFKTEKKDRLDYAWWGGIKHNDFHHKQFITIAEGMADLPAG